MVQEAIQGLVEPVVRMWRRLMGGQELPSQPSGDEYPANLVTADSDRRACRADSPRA